MVVNLRRAGFSLAARTRLRKYLYHRYDYSFSPSQLCFLVKCLDATADVPGSIVEIGCAYGHTTVFLNKHLESRKDGRNYVCIDTFAGFTEGDAQYERVARGKSSVSYAEPYADATLRYFQGTLANNGVTRVRSVKADINSYDMGSLAAVSFCLIDVDLYRPVKSALEKVIGLMSPGGIIVVDDCQPHPLWDGALQAYEEFTSGRRTAPEIVEGQFGLVRL